MSSCHLPHVLTAQEVACIWNVSVKTVHYYLNQGYIRFRETETGHKLINRESAAAYLGEPVNDLDLVLYRAKHQTGLVDTGSMEPGTPVGIGDLQGVVDELSLAGGAGLGEFEYDVLAATTIISERFAALLGVSVAEVGQRFAAGVWAGWVHPEDWPGVRAALSEFLAGGGGGFHEYEARLCADGGVWRWLLFRAVVVERDPHGYPLRTVGVAIDVTRRHMRASA